MRHFGSAAAPDSPAAGRPVIALTLALNYALSGLDVRGYHLFNVAVHLLCALALYGVARRTLEGPAAAGLACAMALLWVVHPLTSECVDYVTQRTESVMALCYLLTLYAAIRAAAGKPIWAVMSVAACALGMASKETMVTAPLAVALHDWAFLGRKRPGLYAALASTWLVLLALAGARAETVGSASDLTPWDYALNQCVMLVTYLRLAVWPAPLSLDYGQPEPIALSTAAPYALAVALLLGATLVALVRRPRLGFPAAWFFLTLAPSSSVVPVTSEVGAERRVYLALAGIVALAVVAARRALERLFPAHAGRAGAVALVAVALPLAALTVRRNAEYQSPLALWQGAVRAVPGNARAHNNLGAELERAGRLSEATAHYRRASELKPGYANAHYNLGNVLAVEGDLDAAIEQYRAALAADPRNVAAHNNLGVALQRQGHFEAAVAEHLAALALVPDLLPAHENLARAYAALGRTEDAARHAREAVRLDPRTPVRDLSR